VYMAKKQVPLSVRYFTALSYLVMVAVNAAAVLLPINGIPTGKISDMYPNLFAPAGITFSIWGVIYLLLAGYALYQLGIWQEESNYPHIPMLTRISVLFSLSSIANAAWIFAWHYLNIPLAMVLMLVILISLNSISGTIKKVHLDLKEKIFVYLPFSIYYGWISVATIANGVVLAVSLGLKGTGSEAVIWTVVLLAVVALLGSVVIISNRNIIYGLVLLWAYAGILVKHTSPDGFAGDYPAIINAAAVCIAVVVIAGIYSVLRARQGSSQRI